MGIFRFSRWLTSTYQEAFSTRSDIEADHVYVDMNEILHNIFRESGCAVEESSFFSHLEDQLDELLTKVVPRRGGSIFFALDGPAANAKIPEQRRRRQIRQMEAEGGSDDDTLCLVSSNFLTPGVPFMDRVASILEDFCAVRSGLRGNVVGKPRWEEGVLATISSTSCAGEGEHKILVAMLNNEKASALANDGAPSSLEFVTEVGDIASNEPCLHVVIGTDSDLCVLPLGPRLRPRRVLIATPQAASFRVCDVMVLEGKIEAQRKTAIVTTSTAQAHADDTDDLVNKTKKQLKKICSSMSLPTDGNVSVLRERISERQRRPVAVEDNATPGAESELCWRWDFILVALLRGNDCLPKLKCTIDPNDLWKRYLQWRRSKSPREGLVCFDGGGLVGNGQSKDSLNEFREAGIDGDAFDTISFRFGRLADFMSFCAGGNVMPRQNVSGSDAEAARGVTAYLTGLRWSLESYVNGYCRDFHFSFPNSLEPFASACLVAKHAPSLSPEDLVGGRRYLLPLRPFSCALAVLPLSQIREMLLPEASCVAPLINDGGLLGELARLEECSECKNLTASARAALPACKASIQASLETHRLSHRDMGTVLLELDAEVNRLCKGALSVKGTRFVRPMTIGPGSREVATVKRAAEDDSAAGRPKRLRHDGS
eukprot:TRINITY_DN62741_c0_g1_i1.p1 TRINITY_DN62741_c0_g1~~TRINITY_DN62741_c0_g1_i1.p1  ORF type:complete len:657 (-),score=94.59 TRINITY_DN62741_c0_g1_i1:306-2276(-)